MFFYTKSSPVTNYLAGALLKVRSSILRCSYITCAPPVAPITTFYYWDYHTISLTDWRRETDFPPWMMRSSIFSTYVLPLGPFLRFVLSYQNRWNWSYKMPRFFSHVSELSPILANLSWTSGRLVGIWCNPLGVLAGGRITPLFS